ncbi:MAG TPA: alpha/beta fold hydrolase [Polyangiales bacterium]|nr:alpha/beta fold hydrolase [Polyangiales bacterium]
MPSAQASGATIHYTVEGAGERALLLLIGLGGHASEWGEPFVRDLARDHRVILMDHRGIGQSQTQERKWTLNDMANDALAVLDAIGLARAHIIGTSMGGMIAQLLAAEHASRVDKLVLIGTSFGGAEAIPATAEAIAALVPQRGVPYAEQWRRGIRVLTSETFMQDQAELIELLVAQRARNPTPGRVFQAQFDALLASDRSELVRGIRAPTLVLHGALDPLVPPENGRLLSERIPGARLLTFEGCGHMPYLEEPVRTAEAIRAFLQG